MAKVPTFKSGDIVRLNSGGPRMTVKEYKFGTVVCQWFTGGKLQEGVFAEASIKLSLKKEEEAGGE